MITAKVGTLKRKQQMREFLEQLPKDNHEDVFTATPFQSRRVQVKLGGCSPAGCANKVLGICGKRLLSFPAVVAVRLGRVGGAEW